VGWLGLRLVSGSWEAWGRDMRKEDVLYVARMKCYTYIIKMFGNEEVEESIFKQKNGLRLMNG
jgi:hypothetical protein